MASPLKRTSSAREVDDEDEDYEDDFDDYSDDDFEDEDTSSPSKTEQAVPRKAPPPAQIKKSSSQNERDMSALRDALASENASAKQYIHARTTPSPDGSGAGSGSGVGSGAGAGHDEVRRSPPAVSASHARIRAPMAGSSRTTARTLPRGRTLPDRGTITIASPTKAGGKNRGSRARRIRELKELVTLSEDKFDLFNQAPIPEHDLYLNRLRGGSLRQTASQTNDDDRTIGVQTEAVETSSKGMHFPDDIGFGGGGDRATDSAALAAQSVRLSRFLQRASAACETLLEENLEMPDSLIAGAAGAGGGAESKATDSKAGEAGDFSTEQHALGGKSKATAVLASRDLVDVCFSSASQHELLCAYTRQTKAPENEDFAALSPGGVLCLWDVYRPKAPKFVLVCPGQPSCCCLSPDRSHMAVVGTEEGSIAVWDLREPSKMHRSDASVAMRVDSGVRQPTYSTDALSDSGHSTRIIRVIPLASAAGGSSAGGGGGGAGAGGDEEGRSSFQVASLDDRGFLTVWVAVEVAMPDFGVSEIDLGLGIGGRVKLVKSGTVSVVGAPGADLGDGDGGGLSPAVGGGAAAAAASAREAIVGPGACTVHFSPREPAEYLVGTVSGQIIHGNRFGGRVEVANFSSPATDGLSGAVACTSLHFSPWNPSYFLAGFSSGTVALYKTTASTPIAVWEEACSGVVRVRWSSARASVFFVLDTQSKFLTWDLLKDERDPVTTSQASAGSAKSPVSSFAASHGSRVASLRSAVVFAATDGTMSVHMLGSALSRMAADEEGQLQERLDSIM